jgi:hypothetical protein
VKIPKLLPTKKGALRAVLNRLTAKGKKANWAVFIFACHFLPAMGWFPFIDFE